MFFFALCIFSECHIIMYKYALTGYVKPYVRHARLLTTLSTDGQGVTGVAELDSNVYLVTYKSNRIVDYVPEPAYVHLNDILVGPMKDPWDMASRLTTGHLYIADRSGECLWLVKTGQAPTVVKWACNVGHPLSLSVLKDD